jgi:peptidoglycan/xylan/chitin deacetylase (PgdA/CDA1 family)
MYHYVHDRAALSRPDGPAPAGPLRRLGIAGFRQQLDALCAAMDPIDWPAFYAWTAGRSELPNCSFLLTFDDGLAEHANNVLPILEERGLRGTFFVPTAVLIKHRMLPAHQIHLLLSSLGEAALRTELRAALKQRNGEEWCTWLDPGSSAAARTMYHYEPSPLAQIKFLLTMKLPLALRRTVLDELFDRHVGSSTRWARHWYLSWSDLTAMESLGHTIGGHGHAHEPYTRLAAAEIRSDIEQCAATLREGLGPDARPFSYPYGSATDTAVADCEGAGFVQAFTTHRRFTQRQDHAHRLPRCDTIDVPLMLEEVPLSPRM